MGQKWWNHLTFALTKKNHTSLWPWTPPESFQTSQLSHVSHIPLHPRHCFPLSCQLNSNLTWTSTSQPFCFCNANNISKCIQVISNNNNQHLYLDDVMYSQGVIPAWSFPCQNKKLTMKASRRQLSSPETALVNFKCSFHERFTSHTGRLEVTKAVESQRWKAHFMKNNFGFDGFKL